MGQRGAMVNGPIAIVPTNNRETKAIPPITDARKDISKGNRTIAIANPRNICSPIIVRPSGTRSSNPNDLS